MEHWPEIVQGKWSTLPPSSHPFTHTDIAL